MNKILGKRFSCTFMDLFLWVDDADRTVSAEEQKSGCARS